MPLILPTLQADMISIYEKGPSGNPSPPIIAVKTAKAYNTFLQPGINAGGGSTTAMIGVTDLGNQLTDILSAYAPDPVSQATTTANAFDACLQTYLSLHQTTIVTTSGLPGLISDLVDLFASPKASSTLFANKFATALNTYTSSATVIGVIPGTPPVPFSGPIG